MDIEIHQSWLSPEWLRGSRLRWYSEVRQGKHSSLIHQQNMLAFWKDSALGPGAVTRNRSSDLVMSDIMGITMCSSCGSDNVRPLRGKKQQQQQQQRCNLKSLDWQQMTLTRNQFLVYLSDVCSASSKHS